MADWDPELYNRFRRFRAEPVQHIFERLQFHELDRIADLGCGSGENTVALLKRSSQGTAHGSDSSPAMIANANKLRDGLPTGLRERISFAEGDLRKFRGDSEYSIIFSNAAMQWVRGHREILASILKALAPAGQLVIQMPANERETAKVELSKLAKEAPWASAMGGVEESFREVPAPEHYRSMLAELGFDQVDCYHHTFEHPMNSPGEIVEWYRSTGLRPFLDALPAERHDDFLAALAKRYERAYGTSGELVFPFRRLFIWARRPALQAPRE